MKLRVIVLISLGLNLAVAVALFLSWHPASRSGPLVKRTLTVLPAATNTIKTNVLVRRQFFSWQEVESENYPAYIANLRAIDCPEQTIRDIIIADVNQLYAKKRATETVTADLQWWRPDPYREMVRAIAEKTQALDTGRRELLTQLLGPDWEQSTAFNPNPPTSNLVLAGLVLGSLPLETRQAVQDISARSAQRLLAYQREREQEDQPVDPVEMARLRKQTRDELAQVLTQEQLEEYLLRYSNNAGKLRLELKDVEITPEEFRALFRARDMLEQQIQLFYSGSDPASVKRREVLEKQIDAANKQALGPERYQAYKVNQDPAFQQTMTLAEKINVPAETALPMYEVNRASEAERERIRKNATLTTEEREEALAAVQKEQDKSLRQLLGEEAYQRYVKNNAR